MGKSICIVTFPVKQSGAIPLSNLVNITDKLSSDKTYVISSNVFEKGFKHNDDVKIYPVNHKPAKNVISRMLNYILTQMKITWILLSNLKCIDICIFFIGGEGLIIPIVVSKIFKRKTILLFAGSSTETAKQKHDPLTRCLMFVSYLCKSLSDVILIYSSRFIDEWKLKKYKNKIHIVNEHYIDFNVFGLETSFSKRNPVGYVGRFSEEKGVINLIEAIKIISEQYKDNKYLLIGDGGLKKEIKRNIENGNLESCVTITGWVPHDELSTYLNKLKLLVIPSYTEGLPNIMLEAMACGTPVLATSVGAIPDVIKDGETGFLLEDNSPECIAETALKILHMPDDKLEKVSDNARALVEEKFTFEAAVERWSEIMEGI